MAVVGAGPAATAVGFFVAAGYAGHDGFVLLTGQMLRLTQNWHSAYLIVSLLAWLALPLAWLAVRRFPHDGDRAARAGPGGWTSACCGMPPSAVP